VNINNSRLTINNSRLEIEEDSAGDVLAARGLVVENVDAVELTSFKKKM